MTTPKNLTTRVRHLGAVIAAALLFLGALTSCAATPEAEESTSPITLYSGRSEELIAPFIEAFSAETGFEVETRYGDSAALAAQLLEEGANSPADLFLSQDAGALGALSAAGLLTPLEEETLTQTPKEFISQAEDWVGITGRARVFAYSPLRVSSLPGTVADLVRPEWKGRVGIAPTNSSFQTFVTAMIQSQGELATEKWLKAIIKNEPKFYEKNSLIVEAIDSGEIDAGLVNHYYLWEVESELGREIKVQNHFFTAGDIGNLLNVSGAGILKTSKNQNRAKRFIQFLLSKEIQEKFVSDTHEFSLKYPEFSPEGVPPLSAIGAPNVNLSELSELQRSQKLLLKVGLL